MPFSIALEIDMPANTPATNPKRSGFDLPAGAVIDEILLSVPSGHQALVPVWIEHLTSRLFPTNIGAYRLNDVPDFPVVRGAPVRLDVSGKLELVGYNEDTANAHKTRAFIRGRFPEEVEESGAVFPAEA